MVRPEGDWLNGAGSNSESLARKTDVRVVHMGGTRGSGPEHDVDLHFLAEHVGIGAANDLIALEHFRDKGIDPGVLALPVGDLLRESLQLDFLAMGLAELL